MKKLLTAGLIMIISVSAYSDEIVNPKELEKKIENKESSEKPSGGSLGALEVVSLLTLAGSAVYFTRKKKL